MKKTTRLRALFEAPEILVMPGAHDALSAKLVERAGFGAVIMGGFPITGSLLAAPDSSQLGLIELAEHYRRVSGAIDIPLFADGDTGFGNVSNVRRTTVEFERAGDFGFFHRGSAVSKTLRPYARQSRDSAGRRNGRQDQGR